MVKSSLVPYEKFVEFLLFMQGQETRDLGAVIVKQGYKWSFERLHGHSRLEILLGLCAFTRPPILIIVRKMVRIVDFKRYIATLQRVF